MKLTTFAVTVASFRLIMGCGPEVSLAPPSGLPHAAATRTCAPNDGPAVAIYLTPTPATALDPSAPYLRAVVWQPLQSLKNRDWSVASGSTDGVASYQSTAADNEMARSGTVTVTSVSDSSEVRGTIDVTFPRAGRIRGGFKATWIQRSVLCG